MSLWKKNFLLSFTLFQLILFASITLFCAVQFYSTLKQEMNDFRTFYQESQSYVYTLVKNQDLKRYDDMLPLIIEQQELVTSISNQQEFYFEIQQNNDVIFSTLPHDATQNAREDAFVYHQNGHKFIYYQDHNTTENRTVTYMKEITPIYQAHHQRILFTAIFAVLCCCLIGLSLYIQMKKIYRPIQNISHELRTPLTLISGYTELLIRTKTTEQEKITMAQEIHDQSTHLQEIIQQLLLMSDLKDGSIQMEQLFLSRIIRQLEHTYNLNINISEESPIMGNHLLLTRLFINLLDNATRESDTVYISITNKTLEITNSGKKLPEKVLHKLNKGKKLQQNEYQGTGQGFLLCREIAALHQARIVISSKEKITTVKISF